jgi:polysaccharide transporter, PST family
MIFFDKELLKNFSYSSSLQLVNILIPLLSYPYLIRVLGFETFGLVIFAQTVTFYLSVLVDFGFNITATKDISINKGNTQKLSEIISSVYIIKITILILSFFVLAIVLMNISFFEDYRTLIFLSMYTCFSSLVLPIWIFQGFEKMKYAALATLVERSVFLLLVLSFVTDESDYMLVPVMYAISMVFSGLISLKFLLTEGIRFKFEGVEKILKKFIASSYFFLSRASLVLNEKNTVMVIASFIGLTEVAFYDMANKIVNLGKIPFGVINQVVYPKILRLKDLSPVKDIIKISLGLSIVIYMLIALFGLEVIALLGGVEVQEIYDITIILSLTIPMVAVSYFLGNCVLVVMEENYFFNASAIYQMAINLLTLSIIVISDNISLMAVIYTLVFSYLFELLYRVKYSKKYLYD